MPSAEQERRAATPVVGNILLVAIVLIVAVVLISLSFTFVEQTQKVPPKGAFEFEYGDESDTESFLPSDPDRGSDNLTVRYTHGETIPSSRINVTVTGAKEINQFGNVVGTNIVFEPKYGGGNLFSDVDEVSAGDSYTISDVDFVSRDGSGNLGNLRKLDLSEATVRVYWISENRENSQVIAIWTGPEA